MADVFGIVSNALALGSFAAATVDTATFIFRHSFSYREARFGAFWGNFVYLTGIVDTDALQTLHWNINSWNEDEMIAWKNSFISSLNSVSVAGTIFASVGITALQVPNMDQTHWTARAFLSSSMILGILATIVATSLQRKVAPLNDALQIRLWLSMGSFNSWRSSRPRHGAVGSDFDILPLASSTSALLLSEAPGTLLNLALLMFIAGFVIYLLFAWLNDHEESRTEHQHIATFVICIVVVTFLHKFILQIARASDAKTISGAFNLGPPSGFDKSPALRDLEERLESIQQERIASDRLRT